MYLFQSAAKCPQHQGFVRRFYEHVGISPGLPQKASSTLILDRKTEADGSWSYSIRSLSLVLHQASLSIIHHTPSLSSLAMRDSSNYLNLLSWSASSPTSPETVLERLDYVNYPNCLVKCYLIYFINFALTVLFTLSETALAIRCYSTILPFHNHIITFFVHTCCYLVIARTFHSTEHWLSCPSWNRAHCRTRPIPQSHL